MTLKDLLNGKGLCLLDAGWHFKVRMLSDEHLELVSVRYYSVRQFQINGIPSQNAKVMNGTYI